MHWDPFEEIERSMRALTHLVSEPARPARTNLFRENGNLIAEFELPGVDKKDIQLNLTENEIEVKVERKMEKEIEQKRKGYFYEASAEKFYRRLVLPERVIPEKANAKLENGVLRVTMPLYEVKEKKKRIEIK